MWKVKIRDQTARSVQSDLHLDCPQKLHVSSSVKKEFTILFQQEGFHTSAKCIETGQSAQSPQADLHRSICYW